MSITNPSATQNQYYNGVFTRFVSSEQEAAAHPNPQIGCAFFVDGENLVLYAKYADGRPMEIYDLTLREPVVPHYVTVEDLTRILDSKLDELSKKFVVRRDNKGGTNG